MKESKTFCSRKEKWEQYYWLFKSCQFLFSIHYPLSECYQLIYSESTFPHINEDYFKSEESIILKANEEAFI